ncbi:MAG: prenyltransferase/squalene oxidase repeat-containing protein [Nitrososphaerales archaeon]
MQKKEANGMVSHTSMGDNSTRVVDWLLEENQPAVRYYTLVDILGRKHNDQEVQEAYFNIPRKGWANEILKLQKRGGYWEPREPSWNKDVLGWMEFLYRPKYVATNWRALVLADLGLTSKDRRIKKVADLVFNYKLRLGSPFNFFTEEACIVGNTARMMTRFGYADDYRVKKLYDRLLEDQKEDGGWNCFRPDRGTLDNWEPLAAYASLPKQKRTRKIEKSIARGAEFYLERKLFEEGKGKYEPWFRFHYPNHYYYDILIGLDLLTNLGYADDARLRPALKILKEKRQSDGTWLLDKVHPDLGPSTKESSFGVGESIKPFALEKEDKPSKWITLIALRVLKRVEDAS